MIKLTIHDSLSPLLDQMVIRSYGLAQQSLQQAGAKVAYAARAEMNKMGSHWFNDVVNGEYEIWRDRAAMKILGKRISHTSGGGMSPPSMANLIGFYLSPHSLTVTVGGGHPTFRPIAFKDGLPNGYYGNSIGSVGSKGRAILHKLNTGEVTSENPYAKSGTPIKDAKYVQNRHFMERGFAMARGEIDRIFAENYEKTFMTAMNNVHVTPIVRSVG